jgi:hypothetical protein
MALGSLYRNANASSTAVAIALERFRRRALQLCGLKGSQMGAAELAALIRRRSPGSDASLEADLAACEEIMRTDTIAPHEALKLIQTLHRHLEKLVSAVKHRSQPARIEDTYSIQKERA